MANSVVTVTDSMLNDSLLLLVGEDGTVTPDRQTVDTFLNSRNGPTQIQLMHINKSDKESIDFSIDKLTYIPDAPEGTVADEFSMDEIARNLYSFRLDHDYAFQSDPNETSSNLEDLAKTLESLDEPEPVPVPPAITAVETKEKTGGLETKEVTLNKTITISSSSTVEPPKEQKPKAKFIRTQRINPPPKLPPPRPKVLHISKPILPIVEDNDDTDDDDDDEEEEEDDEDFDIDDDNDSDFDYEETSRSKLKKVKKPPKVRQPKQIKTPPVIRKEIRNKGISIKSSEKPSVSPKIEKPPELVSPETKPEIKPITPDKKIPKKEKKPPKLILDDFALFSTPDIIRRVGGVSTPATPEVSSNQPAKISHDGRSKSATEPTSSPPKSNRLSVDANISNKTPQPKLIALKSKSFDKEKERRLSQDGKAKRQSLDEKVKIQDTPKNIVTKSKPIILQNIQMVPPHQDSFRNSLPEQHLKNDSLLSSHNLHQANDISANDSHIDHSLNLDASSLGLDPSLLENINNDMISEDILYQVAQSLVSNPDLQNAIDKGLNEGNLVLDPEMEHSISASTSTTSTTASIIENSTSSSFSTGTQIVRPDGRVVNIPPIERPTTRSRNRRSQPEKAVAKMPLKPLDNEHVFGKEFEMSSEEELDDVDDDEEDESEDDPNKLWCICNQPHNNRFMICCDTCEEWYHGKCVNITKAMGQQMEHDGKEWICLFCKDKTLKRPLAAARRVRKASRASRLSSDSAGSSQKNENVAPITCVTCQKPAKKNSIYCSEACILTHAQGVERVVVFERSSGNMLTGNRAPSAANLDRWLKDHPGYETVKSGGKVVTSKPAKEPSFVQSKLKLVKSSGDHSISVAVHKKGIRIGTLKHSPKIPETSPKPKVLNKPQQSPKILNSLVAGVSSKLQKPTTSSSSLKSPNTPKSKPQLVQATIKSLLPSNQNKNTPQKDKPPNKDKPATPNKEKNTVKPKPRTSSESLPQPKVQENIRENVQKTLCEQLSNRLKIAGDLELSEEEIKSISTEIESQLFKCFGDTGQKYRNKYRSLIFNIKDMKNQTLWRRICEKSVNPYQLVRLSPDDLASQELALWREREAKHQLDMIKKSELELLNCSRQYVLKTHKGEQVMEDNRPSDKIDNTEVIKTLTGESVDSKDSKRSDKSGDSHRRSSSKHRRKDRDRKSRKRSRSKDQHSSKSKKSNKDRDRSRRSASTERSKHGDKRRSKSRDKDKHRKSSHKSSRHRKDSHSSSIEKLDKLDKKSKEILEQLVDNKIVPPLEDRLWKHVSQDDFLPAPTVESDSDHEPSSTVTIITPPPSSEAEEAADSRIPALLEKPAVSEFEKSLSPPPRKSVEDLWKGTIAMTDVAQSLITAHEVSGDCVNIGSEFPAVLEIVGRISPDTVWEYITKMKCSNSKIISLVRLNAINIEEKMPYLALYSYLSSRKRLGVVKCTNKSMKDFYICPLASQKPIPQALLPLNGPGFEESRPPILLGIIVRDKRKRPFTEPVVLPPVVTPKRVKMVTPPPLPPPLPEEIKPAPPPRSYTPPPAKDPKPKIILPPLPKEEDENEPYSPEDSDPDSLNPGAQPSVPKVVPKPPPVYEPDNFAIPGLDSTASLLPSSSVDLQRQMEEINKKIEMQKSEIHSISKNLVTASSDIGSSALANIALPSNLQQILDSIKSISTDSPTEENPTPNADANLTIPLMLPTKFARPPSSTDNPDSGDNTIPLNLPSKIKFKPSNIGMPISSEAASVLSSLSEDELVRKATEMLAEAEGASFKKNYSPSANNYVPAKKSKLEESQPRIPGIDD